LADLVGVWAGEGEGIYPTVESFRYEEQLTFGHVGKPFLVYTQRTRHLGTGLPAHAEAGYWRVPGPGRVELVLAHPSGVSEIAEGVIADGRLELRSTHVGLTATAKVVTALERTYELDGDRLRYELRMAAVGQPLQHHLAGELTRVG
jgi:hypothetical protein